MKCQKCKKDVNEPEFLETLNYNIPLCIDCAGEIEEKIHEYVYGNKKEVQK